MATPTLDISEARRQFSTLDRRLKDDRVITITRHNREAFAVVDIDYLWAMLETMEILADPEAMQMLQAGIADVRAGRLRDHEGVKRELL